jgi:mono/diheme cytochrome c family protein/uncharacterized membrane protein
MASRRSAFDPVVLAGIVVLSSLGGRQLGAPPRAYAQADSSRSSQRSTAAPAGTPAARELFQQHCAKCHGADGTGSAARSVYAEIPDFTAPSWAGQVRDSRLQASVLDGKGEGMPPFRGKLTADQARELVAQIRTFAPAKGKSGPDTRRESTSPSGFDEEFRRLEEEMERLRKQFHEASKGASSRERPEPAESPTRTEPPKPAAPVVTATPAASELFQHHCASCHGSDGSGSQVRRRKPEIPDFTDSSWQAKRSEDQLLASILDGKGKGMPPERGKISEEQARGLVAYVRTFAASGEETGEDEHGGLAPGGNSEGEAPDGFFAKLIRCLGTSHPAAVHFPIALLTAAAVAECLRLATGRPAFDAAARYCVWFGALSAVPAGVLGWFVGGFHLTDPDWVLTTHRWLGTSTTVWAVLVLVLSEAGRRRRSSNQATRWGRAVLLAAAILVLATGFFGGALVFGIDHYAWPK